MLSIKFRYRKQGSLKKRVEFVNSVFDFIGADQKKEIFYSDYTFIKVEESKVIKRIGDNLLENRNLDNINTKFVTMIAEAPYGVLRAEINPSKARKHVSNCSHIDIDLEGEGGLCDILKDGNYMKALFNFFDSKRNIISEVYFFDLDAGPDCYTDIDYRILSKYYDPVDFGKKLLQDLSFESKVKEKTNEAAGANFAEQLFQEQHQRALQKLIEENNLQVTCAPGSLLIYGKDMPQFLNLIRDKLQKYISGIADKDVYRTEFNHVFNESGQ